MDNTINIKGVKYPVAYTLRAYKTIEDLTGNPVSELDKMEMNIDTMAAITYAGLKAGGLQEGKPLTEEQDSIDWVLDNVDMPALNKCMSLLNGGNSATVKTTKEKKKLSR